MVLVKVEVRWPPPRLSLLFSTPLHSSGSRIERTGEESSNWPLEAPLDLTCQELGLSSAQTDWRLDVDLAQRTTRMRNAFPTVSLFNVPLEHISELDSTHRCTVI